MKIRPAYQCAYLKALVIALAYALSVLATLTASADPAAEPADGGQKPNSPATVFVVNTTADTVDVLPGDGLCSDGSGNCSLRAAIQEANASAGANIIDFEIPGSGVRTISPTSALPAITETVTIDGYSQSGALPNSAATGSNAVILIELNGAGAGGSANGFFISASNCTIRGLAINRFGNPGISTNNNANNNVIEGNFIGTDPTGTVARPNFIGVSLNSNNNTLGGTTLVARNLISGNTRFGIAISQPAAGNMVQNNYVGVSANSSALGNSESGINIFRATNNLIGGATASARNVISGNGVTASGGLDGSGVYIFGDTLLGQAPGNTVSGNYIGTSPDGTAAIPNKHNGVLVFGAINTTVGGTAAGSGNVVSGNMIDGIGITGAGATGNLVQGNFVGTTASGNSVLGNQRDGLSIYQVGGNTFGGTVSGARNVVSGNGRYGMFISGAGGDNNLVLGNYVGINAAGGTQVPNLQGGVLITSNNNTVGGTIAAARNTIAGNGSFGVGLAFGSGNSVQGNYIGVTAVDTPLSNNVGVYIQDATNNTVGGNTAGAGNLISGNGGAGVRIIRFNLATTGNRIQGNLIGTNPAGTGVMANGIGVLIQAADSSSIGGTTPETRNVISGSVSDGIQIIDSNNTQITGNYIGTRADGSSALSNFGAGITINSSTATANNNQIGGATAGAGNLISGNAQGGVSISGTASSNHVEGNLIGQNAAGTANLANGNYGVQVTNGASSNFIGGTAAGAGNLISGNGGSGIIISGQTTTGNTVAGNKIGTDAAGAAARSNAVNGVQINAAPGNTIGGTTPAARNTISGNLGGGVRIFGATAAGNLIQGNYIGSNAAGNDYLNNANYGVQIESPGNTIGGATAAARNVISGQFQSFVPGIRILTGGGGTIVRNNYIGITADGTGYLFNGQGVECGGAGAVVIDSNVISGSFFGLHFVNATAAQITNNILGLNAAATAPLGNGYPLYLDNTSGCLIGQDDAGTALPNIIAGNNFSAITLVGGAAGNLITRNSIYDNGGLGIDLGNDGATANDPSDADAGSNRSQNYPLINLATTTIQGVFNSTPNRQFKLEFFSSTAGDASGYGEGKTYLTAQTVNTDAGGNATFNLVNPAPVGAYISAVAIDQVTNDTSEFSPYKQVVSPTEVAFAGARAISTGKGVRVEWTTGFEANNLGFNVYREAHGKRQRLTSQLVAGSALLTSAPLLSEQNYTWFDETGGAEEDSAYWIEAIDLYGGHEWFGPFYAERAYGPASARVNSATLSELGRPDDTTSATQTVAPVAAASFKATAGQLKEQAQLAQSASVRLAINRAGFYRVTAEQLFAAGLPANADPSRLRLFADGIEQPINVTGAAGEWPGANAAVEFYGIGLDTPETATRIYYLTVSTSPGLRMKKVKQAGAASQSASYTATVERRDRTVYFAGLLNGDGENFFGPVVNTEGVTQSLTLAQIAPTGGTAEVEVALQGVTRAAHNVRVELNGQYLTHVTFADMRQGTAKVQVSSSLLREGENAFEFTGSDPSDVSLIDRVRVTYPHLYRAENNALRFTATGGEQITVGGFTGEAARVFDVTDPNNVSELVTSPGRDAAPGTTGEAGAQAEHTPAGVSGGYAISFTPAGQGTRMLLALSSPASPTEVGPDYASALRSPSNAADLLILTRRALFNQLAPLVALRQQQGFAVSLIDVADIYDEFSFGQTSSRAIRDFLAYATTNWQRRPQYVLLAGDATYDPKGYIATAGANVVQTKLVDADYIETASDEWLVDFNGDAVGELAIGRLPARTADEMTAMVKKLIAYEQQAPSSAVTFVADASDGFDFAAANLSVRSLLPPGVEVTEIRRGDTDPATAKARLLNAISRGQRVIDYSGHGSTTVWRGNLLTAADAAGLANSGRLPVFVMMTCLNGFFQDVNVESLSEALMKNPQGGAIAVWASTGTTTPDAQVELNREFTRALYGQPQITLGQAANLAKQKISSPALRHTWVLLGDPTMRLK